MKFGIMAPYRMAPLEEGEYAVGFAQLAEELEFESVWVVDHVVMCPEYQSRYPYDPSGRSPFEADTVQPDPLVWLSYVAAATRQIKLATGILILPQRNPVVLAKTLASLDRLSGGRMLLGMGVGWVREEAEAVGTSFSDRGRRADEYIEAMRALWREPRSSYHGEFVSFDGVVSTPKPSSSGGPPIIVGGHSPAAARRAGRLGDGFYPLGVARDELAALRALMEQTARENGRDPAAIEITCLGTLDATTASSYAELGIGRMLVSPPTGSLEALRPILEKFQGEVMRER